MAMSPLLLFHQLLLLSVACFASAQQPLAAAASQGCGVTKHCLTLPAACHWPRCQALLAWSPTPNANFVSFQLTTRLPAAGSWIGVGLSVDKEPTQSEIFLCEPDAEDVGGAKVKVARYERHRSLFDITLSDTVLNGFGMVDNEWLQCQFQRRMSDKSRSSPLSAELYIHLVHGPSSVSASIEASRVTHTLLADTPLDVTSLDVTSLRQRVSRAATQQEISALQHTATQQRTTAQQQVAAHAAVQEQPSAQELQASALLQTAAEQKPAAQQLQVAAAEQQQAEVNLTMGCGETKGCFSSYGSIATYVMVTQDGVEYLRVQLQSTDGFDWIALGFALQQAMNPASVVECVRPAGNGTVLVRYSFNDYYDNQVLNSGGILVNDASYVDGVVSCDFLRPVVPSNADPRIYNLTVEYYLLLARGLADSSGEKQMHTGPSPQWTQQKVNLSEIYDLGEGQSLRCAVCFTRAHGCMMVSAWVLLSSIGILMPRYFKNSFGDRKLFSTAPWFYLHRALMVCTLVCTAVGFILIFILKKGVLSKYGPNAPGYFWAHAPIGIAVMSLVIINPIMSIFRCAPGDERRPIFNWLHFLVGSSAQILGAINIFFGIKIAESFVHFGTSVFWLMVAFTSFHVLIEFFLALNKYIPVAEENKNTYKMTTNIQSSSKSQARLTADLVLLGAYVTIVFSLWLAMIILINIS